MTTQRKTGPVAGAGFEKTSARNRVIGTPAGRLQALSRQRTAIGLWRLGPRVSYHLLDDLGPRAWARAEQYVAGLTPAMVQAFGADRFPPPPIDVVPE